jgi:hypothetical protein
MIIMHYLANFFAGAFLCNCLPHLACGLRGERFPTPFARPYGVGRSSALLNFLWGFGNLVAGLGLWSLSAIIIGFNWGYIVFLTGILILGGNLAHHFEDVRSKRTDK